MPGSRFSGWWNGPDTGFALTAMVSEICSTAVLSRLGLLLCLVPAFGGDEFLQRKKLVVHDQREYVGVARDLAIQDDTLYQLENRSHRLLALQLGDGIETIEVLATKGDGPGDLFAPYRLISVPGKGLVVIDNRGCSLFDHDGTFRSRFRVFTPTLSIAARDDRLFHATAHDRDPFLIEVLDWEGTKTGAFLDRFIDVGATQDSVRKRTSNLTYMHGGFLLSDEHALYFINTTFLKLFKLGHDGAVLVERDMSSVFGKKGKINVAKNEAYLNDPSLFDNPRGYYTYEFFSDAFLFESRIYLLRLAEPDDDLISEEKELFVLDSETLDVVAVHRLEQKAGERIHAMVVTGQKDAPRILLNMETLQDVDVQIVALDP